MSTHKYIDFDKDTPSNPTMKICHASVLIIFNAVKFHSFAIHIVLVELTTHALIDLEKHVFYPLIPKCEYIMHQPTEWSLPIEVYHST